MFYALAWVVFIIPNNLVGGGVTGIAAIIQYCTGFPVSYSFFIINALLLLVALKILGKGFGFKTVFAIIVDTIFLRFLPEIVPASFIQEFALENGKLLCAIFGGAISGLGIAITFNQGGSTGGTDIVALIINKYRAISPGKIIVGLDLIIIASSLIVPSDGDWGHKIVTVLYGYLVAGVCSWSLDFVLSGNKQSVQIIIFSKNFADIADLITSSTGHGVTVLNGQGWYTKEEGKLLMTIVRKNETNEILGIIRKADPTAFVSVGNVTGVYGKGFDVIKK